MRRSYLVVEGPHDVEFVRRLLPPGFARVQMLNKLDAGWHGLVPTKFPHRDDLLKRVPVPTFFAGPSGSIAIDSAVGITNLVEHLKDSLTILATNQVVLDGIGVVLDADEDSSPSARHAELRAQLVGLPGLDEWPDAAGDVHSGEPRCGTFVLPDNFQQGSLEDLMIEASRFTYPGLHDLAVNYVGVVERDGLATLGLRKEDLKDFRKPSGAKKATLACVANVLRPGKALQTALQDGRWLRGDALGLPRLQAVAKFLRELLGVKE